MHKTTKNLEWAVFWVNSGWYLFPSFWQIPAGKDRLTHCPLVTWSTKSAADQAIIRAWADRWPGCYFCVNLSQSGLTVLDVDNKHEKNGSETLFNLELQYGKLPPTLIVQTPSGGFHYYFTGSCLPTVEKLGPGIDTPAMVPIPGSVIPDRGFYKIL